MRIYQYLVSIRAGWICRIPVGEEHEGFASLGVPRYRQDGEHPGKSLEPTRSVCFVHRYPPRIAPPNGSPDNILPYLHGRVMIELQGGNPDPDGASGGIPACSINENNPRDGFHCFRPIPRHRGLSLGPPRGATLQLPNRSYLGFGRRARRPAGKETSQRRGV